MPAILERVHAVLLQVQVAVVAMAEEVAVAAALAAVAGGGVQNEGGLIMMGKAETAVCVVTAELLAVTDLQVLLQPEVLAVARRPPPRRFLLPPPLPPGHSQPHLAVQEKTHCRQWSPTAAAAAAAVAAAVVAAVVAAAVVAAVVVVAVVATVVVGVPPLRPSVRVYLRPFCRLPAALGHSLTVQRALRVYSHLGEAKE